MSRGLSTVHQVWEEYSEGVNGQMSIMQLERQGWKRDGQESQFYCRRNKLYKHIKQRLEDGEQVDAILADLETRRGIKSLNWIQNNL